MIYHQTSQPRIQPHLIIRIWSEHCQGLVQILLILFSKIWSAFVGEVEKEILATMGSIHFRLQKLVQGFGKRHAAAAAAAPGRWKGVIGDKVVW